MNSEPSVEKVGSEEEKELLERRLFLRGLGKWSGAAIAAAIFGAPGSHSRRRPTPASGLTDGVLVAGGGSTVGVLVAAGGSTDGVPVAAGGSTDGKCPCWISLRVPGK